MSEKKYFWFKMEDNFFQKKEIKKLRTIAGGDTYVIIYLKIILLSLKNGGKLFFEGIDDNFASEIALEIDENKDNVLITLEFLFKHAAIIEIDVNEFQVNEINSLIGSETATTIRVRKHRELKKMLQCNSKETPVKQIGNGEKEKEQSKIKKNNISEDTLIAFEEFWTLYQKKIDRNDCLKLWQKIDQSLYMKIFSHVKRYIAATPDKQYRKNPETYLRGECWNDEIVISKKNYEPEYEDLRA